MAIESREIYPNAPLQLVAFELRFPHTVRVLANDSLVVIQDRLGSELPLVESGVESGVALNAGGVQTMLPTHQFYKLFSKDRTSAVTIQQNALVIEATDYGRYAVFRGLVGRALEALAAAIPLPGMSRTGLRYFNEIRVPAEILQPRDWKAYISPDLLKPLVIAPQMPASEIMCRLQFDFGDGRQVTMNHGSFREGEVVMSKGPLRVRDKDVNRPFYLIDIDSAWSAPEGLDDFLPEKTLKLCDQLRTPARDLFEASITEELRREVLRKEARAEHFRAGLANESA